MNEHLINLNREITFNILNNIDIGVIVIINADIIYLNKFMFREFGVNFSYLTYISEGDLQIEKERYTKFINENVQSTRDVTFKIKGELQTITVHMYIINNSCDEISLSGVTHVVTFKQKTLSSEKKIIKRISNLGFNDLHYIQKLQIYCHQFHWTLIWDKVFQPFQKENLWQLTQMTS